MINTNGMILIAKDLQMCKHYLIINNYNEVLCKKDNKELRTGNYEKCVEFFN